MTIHGYQLPASFLQVIASGSLRRERGSWQLKSNRDAFGELLETELAVVYETSADIEHKTDDLPASFQLDGTYGEASPTIPEPSAISDIVDFTGVICFGTAGDGSPFCFDYRPQASEPRIIWWDNVYWRVIAPDFASFLALFDLPNPSTQSVEV